MSSDIQRDATDMEQQWQSKNI